VHYVKVEHPTTHVSEKISRPEKVTQQLIDSTRNRTAFRLPLPIGNNNDLQRTFSLKGRQFFLLSHRVENRRIILTTYQTLCDGRSETAPLYSSAQILDMGQMYREWNKLLACCTQQLNYAVSHHWTISMFYIIFRLFLNYCREPR
jgi:hypothetical protein